MSNADTGVDREVAKLCPTCDTACQRCRKGKLTHVVFGFITHQMLEDEAAGRYVVGGCLVPPCPAHRCNACGSLVRGDVAPTGIWGASRPRGASNYPQGEAAPKEIEGGSTDR